MFNNVVLDVFIGLILLYLLYSLLMTIVSEMLATWLNLRPRILRLSLEKMLNDGFSPSKKRPVFSEAVFSWIWSWIVDLWYIIQRYFLREFKEFKHSFAARFYEVPSIKYLTSRAGEPRTFFTQTKPSYITAENFADSLFGLLKEAGSGATDMEKIQFTLRFNTHHIQAGSLKQLQNLAENSGTDSKLFVEKLKAWYNETQDRTTGWYKKKVQVILFWLGFLVAAIFNVDSIRIAKLLSKDKDAREQMVAMAVEMAKDSARYKDYIVSNGDTLQRQQIIDSGFSRISQDVRDANFILGLGWGTDTLHKPYSVEIDTNHSSYASLLQKINSGQYKRQKQTLRELNEKHESSKDSIDRIQALIKKYKVDSFFEKTSEGRSRIEMLTDSANLTLQRLNAQKSSEYSSLQLLLKDINQIHQAANIVSENSFSTVREISLKKDSSRSIEITGERNYKWHEKVCYVFNKVRRLNGFWGFVITGLMISLGAPFWFDLLKKIVALRGDGIKPEEKEKKSPAQTTQNNNDTPPAAPPPPPSPLSEDEKSLLALESLTKLTIDEQGIVAIGMEYKAGTNKAFLMVMAENDEIKEFLEKKYGSQVKFDSGYTMPIEYSVESDITVHLASEGSEIANESNELGAGTLGCTMKKKGSDEFYFISCWHVMKDNPNWSAKPLHDTIVCENKPLGKIVHGFLSFHPFTGIDIGIAKYINKSDMTTNPDFLIKSQHRAVTAIDFVLSTQVKVFGKVTKLSIATIVHDTINARVKYPDGKTYLMTDVFSITGVDPETGNKKAPTSQGDSGAVVLDEKGTPLGMIIGGGGNLSYAIKFSNLFDADKPFKDYFFNI